MDLQIVAPSSSRGVPGEPQSFRSSQVSPTHVHNAPSCKHAFVALTGWMQSVEETCLWLITSFPFPFCRYSCVRALLVPYRNTGRNMTKPHRRSLPTSRHTSRGPVSHLGLILGVASHSSPHHRLHAAFTLASQSPLTELPAAITRSELSCLCDNLGLCSWSPGVRHGSPQSHPPWSPRRLFKMQMGELAPLGLRHR